MEEIKKIKLQYYIVNTMYMSSLVIFSAVFYVYLKDRGFSYLEINLFSMTFWITSFFTEIPAGLIADKYGKKNSMLISVAIRVMGLILLWWSKNVTILVLAALFTGIGESFKSGTLESWAIEKIRRVNSNFESSEFFSLDKILVNTVALIVTFIGAQVIAKINLELTFIIAPILLSVTGIVTYRVLDKDMQSVEGLTVQNSPSLFSDLKEGLRYIKESKYLLYLMISLLPLQIVLSGPASQWQLYYSQKTNLMVTGYLSVGITMAGMLGHYLSPKLMKYVKIKTYFLVFTTISNCISLLLAVYYKSLVLSFMFFLLHVVVMSAEELSRFSIVNDAIMTKNRTTILSVFNTVEAGVTVLFFAITGYISDHFSLDVNWILSAITMLVLAVPLLLKTSRLAKKVNETQLTKEESGMIQHQS